MPSSMPTYHDVTVKIPNIDGTSGAAVSVHYIEAGSPSNPTLVLFSGFPSSSTQYRGLIPLLSDTYHILAPDFPGFGLTTVPVDFKFTFDNLTAVTAAWLAALDVTNYAMYIFDYGAPVGLRLAMNKPDQVKAIISQNGNAYKEGFGHPFWDPIMAIWGKDNPTGREFLRDNILTLDVTKYQYTAGVPEADLPLIDPNVWHSDMSQNLTGKENQEHQLDMFKDYENNVQLYPAFQEYFRKSQVPLLAVWGKGDPAFIPPGAEAFKKDLPNAVVHLLDAGHFALETKRFEIAEIMKDWLKSVTF